MNSAVILVVAGEHLVTPRFEHALTGQGYCIAQVCSSADAAIETVRTHPPDLVLMDVHLAGELDGIEAAAIIQTQFDLPVVYLAAAVDQSIIDRMQASCPFGYIPYPCDNWTIGSTIAMALARHRADQGTRHALNQAKGQHQAAQALLDDKLHYFAKAAHELRNPLGVIQAVAELLSMNELDIAPDRRTTYLQRMQNATTQLNELLNSIQTYSYSQVGKLDSSPKPIDLVGFCREQITTLQASVAPQHRFQFNPQAAKYIAHIDEQLLWHLVSNLLSNAVKYSPANEQTQGHIQLDLCWTPEQVKLTVSDNGIGIPENAAQKIFEPFYRAENATQIPGTGLGLAIAQQCAERQSGKIYLDTNPPNTLGGACFTVELPHDRATQASYSN